MTPAVTLPLGHWVPSTSPSKFKVPVPSAGTSSVTDYPLTITPSFSIIIPTSPLPVTSHLEQHQHQRQQTISMCFCSTTTSSHSSFLDIVRNIRSGKPHTSRRATALSLRYYFSGVEGSCWTASVNDHPPEKQFL